MYNRKMRASFCVQFLKKIITGIIKDTIIDEFFFPFNRLLMLKFYYYNATIP
jgi:hypothetical protein